MAKKFLSFLGTNKYVKCKYKYADMPTTRKREYETYFVQEALTEIFCKDWTERDEVIIFLTERAKNLNWIESKDDESKRGLEFNLKRHNLNYDVFDNCLVKDKKFKIKGVDIKDGNNMDEIWENFDIIINQINENDEIIFDITYAFRYIPMLALVVLNYAKVLKNIKISGIYYGNFTYENKNYNNPEFNNGEKPIVNLVQLDEILEWSQAVNSFIKYGNSDHIKAFAYEILENENNNNYYKKDEVVIKELVDSLNDFTNTVQTCRGRNIKTSDSKNSITKAYQELNKSLKNFIYSEKNMMKPLECIIESIRDRMEPFKPKNNRKEIINVGVGVVEWSIKNNLIQQAYTSLLESITTYMCILDKANFNDYNIRVEIKRKYSIMLKDYECKSDEKIKGNVKLEIAMISRRLSWLRNDINHYGYTVTGIESNKRPSRSYEELTLEIEKEYNNFVSILEREESLKLEEKKNVKNNKVMA